MSNELIRVSFYDDELLVNEHDGKPWVLLTPVCEALGLDPQAQRRRIDRSAWSRGRVAVMATHSPRGEQQSVCLDLDIIPMWLATISTHRISDPIVRAKLERYQREAADALRRHFMQREDPQSMVVKVCLEAMQGYRCLAGMFADMGRRQDAAEARQMQLERGIRNGGRLAAMPGAYGPLRRARKPKTQPQLDVVAPPNGGKR
jgi:hypothetical protein